MPLFTFTASILPADEDGNCTIVVYADYEHVFQYHTVRFDMASQWTAQELACLNEAQAA